MFLNFRLRWLELKEMKVKTAEKKRGIDNYRKENKVNRGP
jgi:hypothetical protein